MARPMAPSTWAHSMVLGRASRASRVSPLRLVLQPSRAASGHRRQPRRRSDMSSPTVGMAQMTAMRGPAMISFRIPNTFVAPSWRQYFGQPATLAKLLWYRTKSRVSDALSELSVRLQSKPSFFRAARFKPNKQALVPLAKTMHYQMLEATAAGDTATLSRLLTNSHLDEVASLIARRARGSRCQWELLEYRGRPRLVDSKLVMIPGPVATMVRQAVVSIRSRQRFTWTDERGRTEPSVVEKEDVRENIVLVAALDRKTWETSEWRIFGFLPETTVESWEDEIQLMDRATKEGTTI